MATTDIDLLLATVHPTLAHRVRLLLADPALNGRYGVVSASRTYAQQKSLYARFRAGRGNLAANPDRTVTTYDGWPYQWKPKGSFHMVQIDGFGHAVDLKRPWWHTRVMARKRVHPLLAKYGLRATVPSEWWHVQALTASGWVDGPDALSNESNQEETMILLHDTRTNTYRVAIPGEGSAVITSPDHWREVIANGRATGEYESEHMETLLAKIRSERG